MRREAEAKAADLKEAYLFGDPKHRPELDATADRVKAMLWLLDQVEQFTADQWNEMDEHLRDQTQ